jgi:Ca2+-binding RTX toxin-like protein
MRRFDGGKQAKTARRRFDRRRFSGIESLEKRNLLAADFQVVTSGNEIWVEARGDVFDDVFTLTHDAVSNEVRIEILYDIDQNADGIEDNNPQLLVEVFDIAQLEFDAALQAKNFSGFRINQFKVGAPVNDPTAWDNGSPGGDTIDASGLKNYDDGQFTFNGGDGNDAIIGGMRGDFINGGAGNDVITNADHLDVITGGAGFDTVVYGPHSFAAQDNDIPLDDVEHVTGTAFNDVIDLSGNGSNVTIIGGAGNDTLTGGGGNDTIDGGAGNDVITGNAGNDTLLGDIGNDTINGGDGNDTIDGGADNDTVNAGGGNDSVTGGTGNDVLNGEGGNDSLNGGDGNDSLSGGDGNDSLLGGDGDDFLSGGTGNDTLNGGETGETNGDTADYSNSAQPMTVDLKAGTATSPAGGDGNDTLVPAVAGSNSTIENVIGSAGNDVLLGDIDENRLEGRGGEDLIFGREGNDTLLGGDQNDRIGKTVGASITGPGNPPPLDAPDAEAADIETQLEDGDDTIDGGAGDDVLRGGAGGDMISGSGGNDYIEGDGWLRAAHPGIWSHIASGGDTINGGADNDTIFTSDEADPFDTDALNAAAGGIDMADGGTGNDVMYGNEGVDNLIGDDGLSALGGNDMLFGLLGDDFLNGGNGADLLVGGVGKDTLLGGTGTLDGADILRIEAIGAGVTADLPDEAVITGSPLGDLIEVKGLDPFDALGQQLVQQELDEDAIGTVSDYEPVVGGDTLDFVAGFSDFLP